MGKTRPADPVKIITGFIFNDPERYVRASRALIKKLGPVDLESKPLRFIHTDYYNAELGKGLKRRFLSFKKLIDPASAYKLKGITNKIETWLSISGKRSVNIDPGYITPAKIVLLSTKDYTHRIYLKKGIYAEVTLFFKERAYRPWQWTYPDYKTEEYMDFYTHARLILLDSLRKK